MICLNSIDALFALCALFAAFALLLFTVSQVRMSAEASSLSLRAFSQGLFCASVLDSFFSNSASSYLGVFPCDASGNLVFSTVGYRTRAVWIISSASKTSVLEVSSLAHYQ